MTRFTHLPWERQPRKGGGFKNRETSEVMEPIRELCRRLHLRCERNATGMAKGVKSPDAWLRLHTRGTWDLTVYYPEAGCVVMVVATSVHEFAAELEYIRRRREQERIDDLHGIKRGESCVPQPEAVRTL